MKKLILTLLTGLALSGCATTSGVLDNRLACTVAKDELYIVSLYGPIGVASKISAKDQAVVCK